MQIRGYVRLVNTGGPVPDGTEVQIRRHVDDSLIATTTTVGGMYEYFTNGSPGPYYVRAAVADEVHISSSQVVGMSGPLDVGGLPLYFQQWTNGYIPNRLNQQEVIASGAGMEVTVRDGVSVVEGVLYDQQGSVNLPVDAPDSQPRLDTVVIEVMAPGSGRDVEGRTRLVVKKGTPAATPTAPSLTQTTTIWEHPLANITVDPSVSAIASNKVTDRRTATNMRISDYYIKTSMLAPDSVDNTKIKDGTIVPLNMAPKSVETAAIDDYAVTRIKLASNSVDNVKIMNNTIVEANISTPLMDKINERPVSKRETSAADQTVSTAGVRPVTLAGDQVGALGFSGLRPSTNYTVEVSLAFKISGGPGISAAVGYQVVGAATNAATTTVIALPDTTNYLSWTWNHVNTSSPGGAITVRPITSWGIGSYTITWVSISARLDLA